ncbi:hypothetical protein PF003_g18614 [Phytophthora fragariae]|nr:hypothetical protein PF003_g18614 [Phytophthora fragariae]
MNSATLLVVVACLNAVAAAHTAVSRPLPSYFHNDAPTATWTWVASRAPIEEGNSCHNV